MNMFFDGNKLYDKKITTYYPSIKELFGDNNILLTGHEGILLFDIALMLGSINFSFKGGSWTSSLLVDDRLLKYLQSIKKFENITNIVSSLLEKLQDNNNDSKMGVVIDYVLLSNSPFHQDDSLVEYGGFFMIYAFFMLLLFFSMKNIFTFIMTAILCFLISFPSFLIFFNSKQNKKYFSLCGLEVMYFCFRKDDQEVLFVINDLFGKEYFNKESEKINENLSSRQFSYFKADFEVLGKYGKKSQNKIYKSLIEKNAKSFEDFDHYLLFYND